MKNVKRHSQIINVTPALANDWLKKNTQNRPLRNALAETYAEAMRRGEWKLTAEPIVFSNPFTDRTTMRRKGETLMDGQHRLQAIALSGCTVPMTVWFGCDADEFHVLGQGRRRTNADILALTNSDLKHASIVASAISAFGRFGLAYADGMESWMMRRILPLIPNELAAVVKYKKRLRRLLGRESLAALVLSQMVMARVTGEIAEQLTTGIGMEAKDPVRLLFRYLHEQAIATESRDTPETQFYKITYALAKRLQRQECSHLLQTAEGISYLRNAAKDKLEPIMKQVHGETPKNFYTPQISPNRMKLLKKRGVFKK